MYTPMWMKFSKRWRRLAYRFNTKSYPVWIGSTVVSLLAVRALVVAAGPTDTHRKRVAADGSYKIRKFAETSDNPLYRLPEQPQGGHRLDGFNPWTAQAAHYQHH